MLAPRKDGTLRACVDYRMFNTITKQGLYPVPRINECIDSLGETAILFILEANSKYWQDEIDRADRNKTAFVVHYELYQIFVRSFGVQKAPCTAQQIVNVILSTVK